MPVCLFTPLRYFAFGPILKACLNYCRQILNINPVHLHNIFKCWVITQNLNDHQMWFSEKWNIIYYEHIVSYVIYVPMWFAIKTVFISNILNDNLYLNWLEFMNEIIIDNYSRYSDSFIAGNNLILY